MSLQAVAVGYIHIDGEPTGAAEAQNTTCADCTESSGSLLPPSLSKNPAAPAVKREAEEDWGAKRWR